MLVFVFWLSAAIWPLASPAGRIAARRPSLVVRAEEEKKP